MIFRILAKITFSSGSADSLFNLGHFLVFKTFHFSSDFVVADLCHRNTLRHQSPLNFQRYKANPIAINAAQQPLCPIFMETVHAVK